MGLEQRSRAIVDGMESEGKLYLDSKCLSFRSKTLSFAIDLGPLVKVAQQGTWLEVRSKKTVVLLEIGSSAPKWMEKILHPPNLLQKLGVKANIRCFIAGRFSASFRRDLDSAGVQWVKKVGDSQLAFLLVKSERELTKIQELSQQMQPKQSIWIVSPKGDDSLPQNQVMSFCRSSQLGPSKVASFDEHLTAMRYSKK